MNALDPVGRLNPLPSKTSPVDVAASVTTQTAQMVGLSELAVKTGVPDAGASHAPLVSSLLPLHNVKAKLQVCVGTATLSVGDLLAAQAQQVLVLDRGVAQPVDLILEGHVVARGQLVAVGDQFAVRLTELPLPLTLAKTAAP